MISQNEKDIFDLVRSINKIEIPSLKEILTSYTPGTVSAKDLLNKISSENKNILIIDVRSEKEFEDSHLPFAVNFPILKTIERHYVGLIYKKYSQSAALYLAMQYANPKVEKLKEFLEENYASKKEIFIYCWRGGGRSGYSGKMISDLGYNPKIITGGYKSYRREAVNFFNNDLSFDLLEINGLTGTGKTDLLREVYKKLPLIDLEEAAHHFSSLFGQIPYKLRSIEPVSSQTAFENNIYSQIILNRQDGLPFLIESESKKVGDFSIPEKLFKKMKSCPVIGLECSMVSRIERIKRDYFSDVKKGTYEMLKILKAKEKFFRQQLSNEKYLEAVDYLTGNKTDEFIELMIRSYYDKRYIQQERNKILILNTDDIKKAGENLLKFYFEYIKEKPVHLVNTPVLK